MKKNQTEIKLSMEEAFLNTHLHCRIASFSKKGQGEESYYPRLSLGPNAESITAHYKGVFPVPRTPIFHPYNPNENASAVYASGIPHTVLNLKYPFDMKFLPLPLQALLQGIDPNKIEAFFVTQNMPWTNTEPLLIRPHYWVHGLPGMDAAIQAGGAIATNCQIALYSMNPNSPITCDGLKNTFTPPRIISSHDTVCSPDGASGCVLGGVDLKQSVSFFSIIKAEDGRTALTLHWLLNDADEDAIEKIAHEVSASKIPTLKTFMLQAAAEIPSLAELLKDLTLIFPLPPSSPERVAADYDKKEEEENNLRLVQAVELANCALTHAEAAAKRAEKALKTARNAVSIIGQTVEAASVKVVEEIQELEATRIHIVEYPLDCTYDAEFAAELVAEQQRAALEEVPKDPSLAAALAEIEKIHAEQAAKEAGELQKALEESQKMLQTSSCAKEDAELKKALEESLEILQPSPFYTS